MSLQKLSNNSESNIPRPKQHWFSYIALPSGIVFTTILLLGYTMWDSLWATTDVPVVQVVAKEEILTNSNTPQSVIVQASGWVEPDPFPIEVTALITGFVKDIFVLEGDSVEADQLIATLVDDDAKLQVAAAEAELAQQQVLLRAAETIWKNPFTLEKNLAVSQAQLAESQAQLIRLEATILQQESKLKELDSIYTRLGNALPEAISALDLDQAKHKVSAQKAVLNATQKQRAVIQANINQQEAIVSAAETQLHLRIEDRKQLDQAKALVQKAQVALENAKLNLNRTQIHSPTSGIVMHRHASPGSKIQFTTDSMHSAHIVDLYDPKKLQCRVDVPLAEAAKVSVGQKAEIIVDILPDQTFKGIVTRFVHQADISKNTIQVKVAIDNPSEYLKPDMLARVKFLGSSNNTKGSKVSGLTIYAPQEAIFEKQGVANVWRITPETSRLEKRSVQLSDKQIDGWIAITEGLHPGDLLVTDTSLPLKEDQRVSAIESGV